MNVHQMSVTYVSEQDRILLRISTTEGEEMRLWLTRRLMLGLWPALNQTVDQAVVAAAAQGQASTPVTDDASRRLLAEFQREALLQQSDFATPYAARDMPLPAGPEPLLIGEVQLTPPAPVQGRQMRIHFREKPSASAPQHGFQLELTPQLSHGLVHLLERALQQAQWGFAGPAPAQAAQADVVPAEDRPKYLN